MAKTNKELILEEIKRQGLKLGIYHKQLDLLTKPMLKRVIEGIEFESDTDVSIKRRKHVVEIDIVDDEVDLRIITKEEYISRYGDERWNEN